MTGGLRSYGADTCRTYSGAGPLRSVWTWSEILMEARRCLRTKDLTQFAGVGESGRRVLDQLPDPLPV